MLNNRVTLDFQIQCQGSGVSVSPTAKCNYDEKAKLVSNAGNVNSIEYAAPGRLEGKHWDICYFTESKEEREVECLCTFSRQQREMPRH